MGDAEDIEDEEEATDEEEFEETDDEAEAKPSPTSFPFSLEQIAEILHKDEEKFIASYNKDIEAWKDEALERCEGRLADVRRNLSLAESIEDSKEKDNFWSALAKVVEPLIRYRTMPKDKLLTDDRWARDFQKAQDLAPNVMKNIQIYRTNMADFENVMNAKASICFHYGDIMENSNSNLLKDNTELAEALKSITEKKGIVDKYVRRED